MDTGLHTRVAFARFDQLPAEIDQSAQQFGEPGKHFTDTEIPQAAKALTLRAKRLTPSFSQLHNSILPAIAKSSDASYFILVRISTDKLDARFPGDQQGAAPTVLIRDLQEVHHSLYRLMNSNNAGLVSLLRLLVARVWVKARCYVPLSPGYSRVKISHCLSGGS